MTDPRTTAPTACVSVFDTGAHVQKPVPERSLSDTTGGVQGNPITRGPSDCWHSEAYLIGWLVKTHGWVVLEPGVLVKANLQKEAA